MKRTLLAATLLLFCACGPLGGGSAGTSPSSQASSSPTGPLLAIVETSGQPPAQPDTVAIVGLDGKVWAKASFKPRTGPYIGNAAVPLQDVAQVVGTGVYYIDGYGTISVLRANGQTEAVTTFAQQPDQYETWFAVSGDGSRVFAGVLAYPTIGPKPSGVPWPSLVGTWKFDLESAPAGGQPTVLAHFESPTHPDDPSSGWKPTFPVGWTAAGPVAMVPLTVGTQNAWWGGPLYALDSAGARNTQLGGADCYSSAITSSGLIACATQLGAVTVRDSSGKVLWTPTIQDYFAQQVSLAPDGQAISNGGQTETRNGLVSLPTGFTVQGWLDSTTVVGRVTNAATNDVGNLAWIRLSDPAAIHELGVQADFIAPVAS